MEVRDILQEIGIKTIPMEKKGKKAKWLPEKPLQITVKRKKKGKEQRRKGKTHLSECTVPKNSKKNSEVNSAQFQRTARSEQCKEIEENNRMGKTRDLFEKIRDTNETFHAKMGTIKDISGMDLAEAEDNDKRWQEYTEELNKNDLHEPDSHDGVITDLEPDILE